MIFKVIDISILFKEHYIQPCPLLRLNNLWVLSLIFIFKMYKPQKET
jgi:hypothetical protein